MPRVTFSFVLAALAAVLALPGLARAASPPGLVAAYAFDEGTGTTATDASGQGNTGTISGGAWTATAKHGAALSFNGSSSVVTVPASASLALASGTTFEAWVRPTSSATAWKSVVFKEQPNELVYALYSNSDRGQPAGIAYTGGAERTAYGPSALPVAAWTHIAVTHDGLNARLYVNGTLVSTAAASGAKPTTNGILRIGGNGIWNEWFAGQIDDVRVYNRPLSAGEIAGDMAVGVTPTAAADTTSPTAPSNLVASGATQTSIALSWNASTDAVGVTGYGLYRNSASSGSTTSTSTTFTGLTCGTSYTLAVDAYDAAGNRSAKSSVTAATSACPTQTDTQAPTAPSGLFVTGSTTSSVSLSWSASFDNVGVTGYGLYTNGTSTGTSTSTSGTFTGLACGTTYTLGIDARDAAGNRSAVSTISAATAACPPPPPPSSANVYVATGGNDSTCVRGDATKPCVSFNKAFAIAQSGDVVQVAAGAYGSQNIAQSSKTAAVTVRPAAGATVTISSLSVNASHFHIVGIVASGSGQSRGDLSVCSSECNPGLVDVLIQDGGFRSAFIRASGVTVKGGDFGGFDACNSNAPEDGFRFWGGSVVAQPVNDVLDGVTIHDISSGSGNTCQGTVHAGYHVDCMQNQGGQNITIKNSTFYNCPTSDIQMEPFSGATIGNVTIENNFFGPTACCNSVVLGNTATGANCSTLVIRYNVLYNTPNPDRCATGASGVQVYGNIFPVAVSCSNDTFDHNVFAASGGSTCGTAPKRCTPSWVSTPSSSIGGPKPNAHLAAGDTCAKAAGDPARYPSTDFDGQARPQGSTTPDVGADEIG